MESNKNLRLCKTCAYRAKGTDKQNGIRCEYILITGHSRGCSAKEYTVYKQGQQKKKAVPLKIKKQEGK